MSNGTNSEGLSPENTALILIDYNTDLMLGCRTIGQQELRNNALALAKFGTSFGLPTIMTGDETGSPLGPVMPEIKDVLPEGHANIHRKTVDSMKDEDFVTAVEQTGRQKLIMAGITTDMCLAQAAITASRNGYEVHVVVDASATWNSLAEQAAMMRMTQAGAVMRSWVELAAELARGYEGERGQALQALYTEHLAEMADMVNNLSGVRAMARGG